jgi:hypothetical protein
VRGAVAQKQVFENYLLDGEIMIILNHTHCAICDREGSEVKRDLRSKGANAKSEGTRAKKYPRRLSGGGDYQKPYAVLDFCSSPQ